VATFWSATCASYGDGVAFVVFVTKHMDSSIYRNQCNSLAMKHIPPLNETKTFEKKSRTKVFYLASKGMDVATCSNNKEVMLEGGSNVMRRNPL
jgi:hypothetical protein